MKALGKYLKERRAEVQLSQQAIADQLKVDRSTYTYYELGKTTPNILTLLKLSKILSVPFIRFATIINEDSELYAPITDDDLPAQKPDTQAEQ